METRTLEREYYRRQSFKRTHRTNDRESRHKKHLGLSKDRQQQLGTAGLEVQHVEVFIHFIQSVP